MTTPRYPQGCSGESQEHGQASASDPAAYAWNVNLNNGNCNINNQNNHGLVVAVRGPVASPGECRGAATFADLYRAWRLARRQKCSRNQLRFEARLQENLLQLEEEINAGTWSPAPSTCFVATKPKARQIHAPNFRDRVVHHWLVPQLEAAIEPQFIHDSFSNRKGKGTHAAVERLHGFIRQVHSGQGGGWYLQLDIHNCFNSMHRPTLWADLRRRMERAGLPEVLQRTAHALLRRSPLATGVRFRGTAAELASVPMHKRLEHAAPGCGLPIGNLSSQFLANVYLDPLDQFVKHTLKAKRYVRYVDDFVLVHHDRAQLEAWHVEIERFLQERLRLSLKADVRLRPLTAGIDFLGYVLFPDHRRVRRRVITHARDAIAQWGRAHVGPAGPRSTPEQYRQLCAVWASYQGHWSHAGGAGLERDFHRRFPWLAPLVRGRRRFDHRLEGRRVRL